MSLALAERSRVAEEKRTALSRAEGALASAEAAAAQLKGSLASEHAALLHAQQAGASYLLKTGGALAPRS